MVTRLAGMVESRCTYANAVTPGAPKLTNPNPACQAHPGAHSLQTHSLPMPEQIRVPATGLGLAEMCTSCLRHVLEDCAATWTLSPPDLPCLAINSISNSISDTSSGGSCTDATVCKQTTRTPKCVAHLSNIPVT